MVSSVDIQALTQVRSYQLSNPQKNLSEIPENGKMKQNTHNLDNMLNNKKPNEADMTQSDAGFTTWSQLKKSSDFIQMQR
jgi:uncharacterized protein YfaQ (DUF2300 family)